MLDVPPASTNAFKEERTCIVRKGRSFLRMFQYISDGGREYLLVKAVTEET